MDGLSRFVEDTAPFGVIDEVGSSIEEIGNAKRCKSEENSSWFERAADCLKRWLEVIHPVQPKEANGDIELLNAFVLSFYILLLELHLGLEGVIEVGEVDHILRHVIPNDPIDFDPTVCQSLPESKCGKAISAAEIDNRDGLFGVAVLFGDDIDESI